MGACETVTIKTKNGPVDINKADYDPDVHKLVDASEAPNEGADAPPKCPKKNEDIIAMLTGYGVAIPEGAIKKDLIELFNGAIEAGKHKVSE